MPQLVVNISIPYFSVGWCLYKDPVTAIVEVGLNKKS